MVLMAMRMSVFQAVAPRTPTAVEAIRATSVMATGNHQRRRMMLQYSRSSKFLPFFDRGELYQPEEPVPVLDGACALGINEPNTHTWRLAQHDLLNAIIKPDLQRRIQDDDALRALRKFGDGTRRLKIGHIFAEQQFDCVCRYVELQLTKDVVSQDIRAGGWLL